MDNLYYLGGDRDEEFEDCTNHAAHERERAPYHPPVNSSHSALIHEIVQIQKELNTLRHLMQKAVQYDHGNLPIQEHHRNMIAAHVLLNLDTDGHFKD